MADTEQIKDALDLESIIRKQATDWQDESTGGRVGRCTHPEHGHTSDDSNAPNLIVTNDGLWYCYSHKTGGDVFSWIAVEEGIVSCRDANDLSGHFRDVLEIAAERAGVELEDDDGESRAALTEIINYLHGGIDDNMLDSMTVRRYIKEARGFTDETINRAKIGYLGQAEKQELSERYDDATLKDLGFLNPNGSWHASERIIYPFRRARLSGRPTYWVARRTDKTNEPGDPPKYLKPRDDCELEQPLYDARRSEADRLWVVEGIQDALSIWQSGEAAVAPVATNPSDRQSTALADANPGYETVVVAFDGDDAGTDRGLDTALNLMSEGVSPSVASLPEDTDPNDLLANGGDLAEIETDPAIDAILAERGDDLETIRSILKTVEPDSLAADMTVDRISTKTPIRKRTLRKELQKAHRKSGKSEFVPPERVEKIAGESPVWRFVFPSGDRIELDETDLREGPGTFEGRYLAKFDHHPNISADEWPDLLNGWLEDVEVIARENLSEDDLLREEIERYIERAIVLQYDDRERAVQQGSPTVVYHETDNGDVEYWLSKSDLETLLDDWEVSLNKLSRRIGDMLVDGDHSVQRRCGNQGRVRFWRFARSKLSDPDAVDDPLEPETDTGPSTTGPGWSE